ncbi:hypothetical protein GGX14DRAFT_637014 [Mycena pura]|uniref:F-box domain-containing protein n=1 Tax=Mycena pura TaxID=153505 RepID=A0AAD6YF99_9AGAR|nr:hypothetical protein GGX14DRAFT_637014 [Mycena pura]
MASLEQRSHHGEALRFGDGITRIAYPGVLIESMDFEELAAWLAIRNSMSLHPCPQCLAHKNDLPRLTRSFTKRTSESMSCALARAPIPKTERNEYLKQYGLHDFEHFLWNFNNSDPYKATGYDCLHFFDGGIWGRHMWPLIKGCLQRDGLASKFNTNMDKFPRWRDLKHFSSPTTIDYSDGQTFLDILKSSLPCIVQLLPANSCLVRLIRVMTKVRALLGLEVTLDSRLAHLHKFIAEYERICNDVSETHNKSLNFLKQHFLSHAINCFKDKGTSRNQNTRVGEGFQQEIAAQYKKTNGKDAEHQMSIMDENEETMARLDMKVDEWRKSQEDDEKDPVLPHAVTSHWKLGSADARMTSTRIETVNRSNSLYRDFNMRLREYLAEYHPNHPVHEDQNIEVGALLKSFVFNLASVSQVEPCKVLYVDFQSKVDWNNGRDILRCNPMFHGRQRYDSVIYEAQDDNLAMDLAMIRPYRKSSWAARTRTDCPMREWSPGSIFIALEHVTRGALLCPIFGAPHPPIDIQVLAARKNETLFHSSEEIAQARSWLLAAEKELQRIEDSDSARREKLLGSIESSESSKGTNALEKTLVVVRAQEELRRLEERRAALIEYIQVYRVAFSPHRVLRVDILREIFTYCTYTGGRREAVAADLNSVLLGSLDIRQAISCVCSLWRCVVIHSPELWSNVRAVFGQAATELLLRILPRWLARAQDSLLTLDLDHTPTWKRNKKHDRLIADFLAQYSPRCRVIRTRSLVFPTPQPFVPSGPGASLETLVLENISFTGHGPPLATSAALQVHSLTLKALPLAALQALQTCIQWDHLQLFFAENLPRHCSTVYSILTQCTTLRMANIAVLPDADDESLPIPYQQQPRLSELRILRLRTDYLFNSARFLVGITAQSLTELTINVLGAKEQKAPHPPRLPNLRLLTLDLRHGDATDAEVIPWLCAAPALQEAYLLDYTPLRDVLAKLASGILLPSVRILVLRAADLGFVVEMLEARQQDAQNSTISELGFIGARFRESDWKLESYTADALGRLFNADIFVASPVGGFRTPKRIERLARRDFAERRAAFSRSEN